MKIFVALSCLLAVVVASYYPHHGHHYGGYHFAPAPLDHKGRAIDTPEVALLKAKHFAAHEEARARVYGHGGYGYGGHGGYELGGYGGHGFYGGHYGSIHIPVIGPHGVPYDTPEVAAARQHHLQALAEARARSHGYGYGRGW